MTGTPEKATYVLPDLTISESPRTATISTAHVSAEDQPIIADLCWSNDTERGEHWILSTSYGWIFCLDRRCSWITDLMRLGISTRAIFNLKRVADCGYQWINLEADGDLIDELFQWDW